jgi:hypothetical protein
MNEAQDKYRGKPCMRCNAARKDNHVHIYLRTVELEALLCFLPFCHRCSAYMLDHQDELDDLLRRTRDDGNFRTDLLEPKG